MKRKITSLLVILCMVLAMLPVSTFTVYAADGLTVTGGVLDTDYTYAGDVLTITSGTAISISSATTTPDKIVVQSGITANITLNGVNIDVSTTPNACAFDMTGATVNLTLAGTNILKSGDNKAGLQAPSGTTLNIDGPGALSVTGGSLAAGIGGGETENAGTITINGGTITATSGLYAAGMGGGHEGSAGIITINNGTVTATGVGQIGAGGAGIGTGNGGNNGTITITGGTITATGGENGAGIGSGNMSGTSASVNISGGMVTATGTKDGAGIGGGGLKSGGTIDISGGTVSATSTGKGAGIGGGIKGEGGEITIRGNSIITATGGNYGGAGIGGGHYGSGGEITICGNSIVTTTGGQNSSGVGSGESGASGGKITITENSTLIAIGDVDAAGIGGGITIPGALITIEASTKIKALSYGDLAIQAVTGSDINSYILMATFTTAKSSNTKTEMRTSVGTVLAPVIEWVPANAYKSIAFTLPSDITTYTVYTDGAKQQYTNDATNSNKFAITGAGLSVFNEVTAAPVQATPTFSPAGGAIAWGTPVNIISVGADAIYYTTDGSDPTTASTNQATTPLVIDAAMTVKAIAVKAGSTNSPVGSASYTQVAANAPSTVVMAVGSTNPVGGVTNVAIPAAGGTDNTGKVTGWVTGTNDKIKFTVTDAGGTSAITINGEEYFSGADYTIPDATPLNIVITTTESGKITGVRTFTVTVAAASSQATPTFSPAGGAIAWGTTVSISSSGADAIYYTTDGSIPTSFSTNQATTPLVIDAAMTVKAIAVKAGSTNSPVGSASYTQVAANAPSTVVMAVGSTNPVGGVTNVAIPAAGGTDNTGKVNGLVTGTNDKIKFTVTDAGGTSVITINGSAYISGADYTIPDATPLNIVVTTTELGKITGVRTFTVTVAEAPAQATPTFSPAGGDIAWGTTVSISSSGADAIYYTTDGSIPTSFSTNQATTPLVIDAAMTVKAIAVKAGSTNSPVASASYTQGTASAPSTVILSGGSTNPVGGVTNVEIPAASGTDNTGKVNGWVTGTNDKIKFTVTDAGGTSVITINGEEYFSGADYTISAETQLNIVITTTESGKITGVRTFTVTVAAASSQATPTFSPAGGDIAWGTTVNISSAGADAIYYTTDGSDPTTASTNQATTPLVIDAAMTVKAIAVKAGSTNSPVASASYTQGTASAPSTVILSGGSTNPVGGVTNVEIPAASGTDNTGKVNGWVTGTYDKIKFTVTDAGGTSAITINGEEYFSGADYTISAATPLNIVITTTESGKITGVRTFTVTVTAASTAPTAPYITIQPSDVTVTLGSDTSIMVATTGTSITYQWQVNNGTGYTNITDGGVYSGVTTSTLRITNVILGINGYHYRVIVTGMVAPAVTSTGITLTVNEKPSGGSSRNGGSTSTTVIKTNTGSVTGNQLNNAAGIAKNGETVTIKSNKTSEVTFPTSGLDSLTGKNNSLTVVTDNGTLTFNSKAVAAMGTQAAATNIKVIVEDVVKTTLTGDQQAKVGDKNVYDLTVISGGKLISNFNGGNVYVSIPYELKEGETADNLTVWYMADDGSLTEIKCTYDTKTKSVAFVVDHFSKYIIGYDDLVGWVNPFTDVKSSAWYYNAVAFVNMNGLMNGQTDTTFGSEIAMTRSMFVTILGRMEGVDAAMYANENTFSDVKNDQYYTPYIAWASDKGIVSGTGGDKFAPNAAVTREQMAVMITNYMKFKDQGPKDEWAIQFTYGDLDKVSSWADESVMFMTMKDLMKGIGNDANGNPLFAPKSTSTRAQTAQVMMSLEELLK